jgi:transposase
VIATKPVDFRKGHDGLAAYVEKELGLKAHSGVVVVFRAKRADRVKILVWDGNGLVLTYKRLEMCQRRRQNRPWGGAKLGHLTAQPEAESAMARALSI